MKTMTIALAAFILLLISGKKNNTYEIEKKSVNLISYKTFSQEESDRLINDLTATYTEESSIAFEVQCNQKQEFNIRWLGNARTSVFGHQAVRQTVRNQFIPLGLEYTFSTADKDVEKWVFNAENTSEQCLAGDVISGAIRDNTKVECEDEEDQGGF
jgi:hypothetical protein